MSVAEEIERLSQLNAQGQITDDEFVQAKEKLLREGAGSPSPARPLRAGSGTNVNQWCMYIHLSQLAGFVVPGAGFIVPIVLWQMKKDESPVIDQHGKSVANWLISALIYAFISGILTLILIGALGLMVLGVAGVVFAIIGGLKANDGEFWKYPATIEFLKQRCWTQNQETVEH